MRVILFGVDGLTFRILHPLMEQGLLPHFQRLRDEGVQGILHSTTPPMTPPAWVSISTGLKQAGHGVYDFWSYEQTEQGPRAHIQTHRKGGRAIWNILSNWGKQVIVANIPLTYPPEPVNGIMVSGYMAPAMQSNVTYPASFKEELLQAVPDYQIDLNPAVSAGQLGDPLAETLKMTKGRIALFRLLLGKPWDFCFIGFSGADRIQHLRWDSIMAAHPKAIAYYQLLDEALGMALSALGSEDMLMVVSDHGFQGTERRFYIHEYLYRQGLLKMSNTKNRCRAQLLGAIRGWIRASGLQKAARHLRSLLQHSGVMALAKEHHVANLPDLDWTQTQAWIPSSSGSMAGYADIFLSDTLSEERIEKLVTELHAIHDPETGQALVKEIFRQDVFGTGPFAPVQRHLIVLVNEGITLPTELGRKSLWEKSDPSFGIHHPDGVLYLFGAGIKRGATIASTHVCDVVPTILRFMQLPLPENLDGQVIQEAFIDTEDRTSDTESMVMRKLKKRAEKDNL